MATKATSIRWMRPVLLAGCLSCAGSAPPPASSSEYPELIGAEDCGGCRANRGTCSAYFAANEQGAEGKEVPCDPSCCSNLP